MAHIKFSETERKSIDLNGIDTLTIARDLLYNIFKFDEDFYIEEGILYETYNEGGHNNDIVSRKIRGATGMDQAVFDVINYISETLEHMI